MKYLIYIFLIFLILQPIVYADITNPSAVELMKTEITQKGTLQITGSVGELTINLSIPQDDKYQDVEFLEISEDYSFVTDLHGNRFLKLDIENPGKEVEFTVKTLVTTRRRNSFEINKHPDYLKPTDLIQADASEVAELASTFKGDIFEKTSKMAKWINENIEYDMSYVDVNNTATHTLDARKGTCDEFSTLMLSLARNLGIYSAYAAGYAYATTDGMGGFIPHGWVEIHEGDGINFDPTWSEGGYLDGAHIKFSTLGDGIFKELQVGAAGYGVFNVQIDEVETDIKIIDVVERLFIESETTLIEDNVWRGYAVTRTDLSYDGCLLTKIKTSGCRKGGREFVESVDGDRPVFFCDSKRVFSIFKLPDNLDIMSSYTCPLSIITYAGTENIANLKLISSAQGNAQLVLSREKISPGNEVEAVSSGSHIFTSEGDYGFSRLKFKAPDNDFDVYAYDRGSLSSKHVEITNVKAVDISIISQEIVEYGDVLDVKVLVKNLLSGPRKVTVRLGDQSNTETVDREYSFDFIFSPGSVEDNMIRAYVDSGGYSSSATKVITVKEKPISGLFAKIKSLFSNLFGMFR